MRDRPILGILNAAQRFGAGDQAPNLLKLDIKHGFDGRPERALPVHYLKQVHGTGIVEVSTPVAGPDGQPRLAGEGDAVTTSVPGLSVAARTADCLPVLIADQHRRRVIAVHAGWRGLMAGMLPAALEAMKRHGCASNNLVAAIGPAIGRDRFEVGPEVVEALMTGKSGAPVAAPEWFLTKGKDDRWHIDLSVVALLALTSAGIPAAQIAVMDSCTYDDAGFWYSFRREGKGVGSNWAWIRL